MTTLSGPDAASGQDMADGFRLGLKQGGAKSVELVVLDDHGRGDFARALSDRLVRERIDIVTGFLSAVPLRASAEVVLSDRSDAFMISIGAGPAEFAGRGCHPNFFSAAPQNDTNHEAVGVHMAKAGIRNVYLLAPNSPEAKEAISAFKRSYKGGVSAEVYTRANQTDYTGEIAALRSGSADAVYALYSGTIGAAFMHQVGEASLGPILVGAPGAFDLPSLTANGSAMPGAFAGSGWSEKLPNKANQSFVLDFESEFGRRPSIFAAHAFDAARLVSAALRQADGAANRGRLRDALRVVEFPSVRGQFKFNRNHFPVQNFYLTQLTQDQGRLVGAPRGVILASHADGYAAECRMKWQ